MTVVWFGNIVSWTDAHAKIQKEHELNNDQIYARVLRLDKRKEKSVPKWFRISSYLFLILQIVITIIKLITQVIHVDIYSKFSNTVRDSNRVRTLIE